MASTDGGTSQAIDGTYEETPTSERNRSTLSDNASPTPGSDRIARFKALRNRAKESASSNLKAATAEQNRLSQDPSQMTALSRRHAIASQKLLKADTEEAGEDFERKRAWDWTIEESEKWDRRMEKKSRHREDVAFQDYTQESNKVYKRQIKEMRRDVEGYEDAKREAVEKAAKNGGLEVVELESGELVAIDKEGTFYANGEGLDFVESRPKKENVDKLVEDLRKAEESRLRKRRDRGRNREEDGDVTFINDKNKQFNQKLARFYNKYTADIRESFERGTAV
ncbi:MAG: hypothetical protein Q9227_008171 [Pyrenula ochraceoflavens]